MIPDFFDRISSRALALVHLMAAIAVFHKHLPILSIA
jgi:hypothetical protein